MLKKLYIPVLFLMLLAACAPGTSDQALPTVVTVENSQPPTAEVLPDPEAPEGEEPEFLTEEDFELGIEGEGLFSVTVTGATEATFAGPGLFICEEGTNLLTSATDESALEIYMPTGMSDGEYTIGTGDIAIRADLIVDGTLYSGNDGFGILTFEVFPTSAGKPVSGSFDLNYTTEAGETINAVGTFDLLAEDVCIT